MATITERGRKSVVKKNNVWMTMLLWWCGISVVSSLYVTIPLTPILAHEFGVGSSVAAWAGSSFSFAYAVGFLLFAPLSDRYGRKQVMLGGLIALAVISPVLGVIHQLSWLIGLRAVQGLAAATFAPAALAYVVEMYPLERRVSAIGFVSAGFLMAGIVGQVSSGIVSQAWGWSSVFYVLGGVYVGTAFLLGVFLPKGDVVGRSASVLAIVRQMGTVLFRFPLFWCYLIAVTLLLSFVGMYTALGSYISQSPFGLNQTQILWVRAAGVIGMLLSPFAGRFVAAFGMKKVLQTGLFLAVIGLGMMSLCSNLALLIGMSIVFVAGISVIVPTLISLIGNRAGEARGTAVALYTFLLFIGATLGPIVTLELLKLGSYSFALGSLAVLVGIGSLASCLIDRET